MSERIRILIVDDDPLVRSGLRMMLAGAQRLDVVGEASDGGEVLAAVDAHHPDVVLMDLRMPRVDGLAAMELLRQQPRPPEVIVAVGHGKSNAEIATELFMSVARVPTAGKARRGGTGFRSLYSSKRRGSIGPISPR